MGVGECVLIWHNSEQRWEQDGEIVEIFDKSITVKFCGGSRTKTIPVAHIQDFIQALQPTQPPLGSYYNWSALDTYVFNVGDKVKVWSTSENMWFDDGNVVAVSEDVGVTVT